MNLKIPFQCLCIQFPIPADQAMDFNIAVLRQRFCDEQGLPDHPFWTRILDLGKTEVQPDHLLAGDRDQPSETDSAILKIERPTKGMTQSQTNRPSSVNPVRTK